MQHIPYIEVIGKYTLQPIALVEPSQIWGELSYYDIGECEIYTQATPAALNALKNGNYLKIPNKPYLWIIKTVRYTYNANGARMISAKGYEAGKWLLTRRIIPYIWQLPTDLAAAIQQLANKNLGSAAESYRKIAGFTPIQGAFNVEIDATQATRGNLWDFVANLLKANFCGSTQGYNNGAITFTPIKGQDRTSSVIFSQSLDNLLNADYTETSEDLRTYCQVVSTFTNNDVQTDYVEQYPVADPTPTGQPQPNVGIDRSEITIQSNLSNKYIQTDASGNPVIDPSTGKPKEIEVAPDSATYKGWQRAEGRNTLSEHIIRTSFNGEIDLNYSPYVFGQDYFIGDVVKVKDEYFNYEANVRILKYTFKQDSKGYGEEADYATE